MKTAKRILIIAMTVLLLLPVFSCSNNSQSKDIIVSPELRDAYNEAIDSMGKLRKKTIKQMSKDYEAQLEGDFFLNGSPGLDAPIGSACLGNFGDCIVYFSPGLAQAAETKVVADEFFSFNVRFSLFGYHDGEFYPLNEAYEKGYITKEEVSAAAQTLRKIRYYNQLWLTYRYAEMSLSLPEESIVEGIEKAYNEKGQDIKWFNVNEKKPYESANLRCYGDYEGCTVLILTLDTKEATSKTVADVTFESQTDFELWAYYGGSLYTLSEAYEKGYINKDEIGSAKSNHEKVEDYIFWCGEGADYFIGGNF